MLILTFLTFSIFNFTSSNQDTYLQISYEESFETNFELNNLPDLPSEH